MKRIFYLIPLVFILGCAKVFPQKEVRPSKPKEAKPSKPVEPNNVFNAPFGEVWSATLAGLEWMKWNVAFTDKEDGTIRLKEAYVYKKSGKLFRIYRWPSKEEANESRIDDYLEKVAYYDNSIFNFDKVLFSQETMEVKVISLSKSQTKAEISYKIKPYLDSGEFASQVKSNGYIESLLLEKIRERLKGKPLSYRDNSQIYVEIPN